ERAGISVCLVRLSVGRFSLGQRQHRSLAGRSGSTCSSPRLRFIKAWPRSPALHQLTLAFTWTGGPQKLTVQVLNLHSWTFFFAMACVLGLYSLHRLSFVKEPSGATKRLVFWDVLLEARRSVHS